MKIRLFPSSRHFFVASGTAKEQAARPRGRRLVSSRGLPRSSKPSRQRTEYRTCIDVAGRCFRWCTDGSWLMGWDACGFNEPLDKGSPSAMFLLIQRKRPLAATRSKCVRRSYRASLHDHASQSHPCIFRSSIESSSVDACLICCMPSFLASSTDAQTKKERDPKSFKQTNDAARRGLTLSVQLGALNRVELTGCTESGGSLLKQRPNRNKETGLQVASVNAVCVSSSKVTDSPAMYACSVLGKIAHHHCTIRA